MLSRLLIHKVGQRVIQAQTLRFLRVTAAAAFSDHEEPLPVYEPKPAVGQRNWLGSLKTYEQYPCEPYKPGKWDLLSFIGAGLGVTLTVLAVTFYNDLFGILSSGKHSENLVSKSRTAESTSEAATEEDRQVESKAKEEGAPSEAEASSSSEEKPATEHDAGAQGVSEASFEGQFKDANYEKVNRKTSTEAVHKDAWFHEHEHEQEQRKKHYAVETVVQTKYTKDDTSEQHPKTGKSNGNKTGDKAKKEEVPEFVEYLLVGAGTAAYYASLAIRARHADAKVLMIGEEDQLPYNRPPLSKELWWYGDEKAPSTLQYTGLNGKKRDIFFEAEGFFVPVDELPTSTHGGVSLLKGRRVERISPEEKKVYLEDKTCIKYDKCLIATGGKPKALPVLEDPEVKEKVVNLHVVEDYRKLESICRSSKSVTIVGGGFLGSELAYSIHRKYGDLLINQVIAESGNLSDILPEHLSKKATESVRETGVNVLTNARITSARRKESGIELEVNRSKTLTSDYVLVAVGVDPDVTLAKLSGLEVDNQLGGISTDAELRVRSGIWAAGDAASFYDKSLGRRRIEHWENAQISGRLAGENMTGACKAFWYQPSFFTKIAPKWHISAVGNTNSSLPTVSVFAKNDDDKESYDRGVVFYKGDSGEIAFGIIVESPRHCLGQHGLMLYIPADEVRIDLRDAKSVVGVLLLNVYGSGVDVARRLIEEARNIEDFQQLAKLFSLYKPTELDEEET